MVCSGFKRNAVVFRHVYFCNVNKLVAGNFVKGYPVFIIEFFRFFLCFFVFKLLKAFSNFSGFEVIYTVGFAYGLVFFRIEINKFRFKESVNYYVHLVKFKIRNNSDIKISARRFFYKESFRSVFFVIKLNGIVELDFPLLFFFFFHGFKLYENCFFLFRFGFFCKCR